MPGTTSFATPPAYAGDELGNDQDSVILYLGGERVAIAESWEYTRGILSQPSRWSIRLGWGGVVGPLLQKYPKRTSFEIHIANRVQATGLTDGIEVNQAPGGASELVINGRDSLARLQDSYVTAQATVNVDTYEKLVWYALQQCNLAPPGDIDDSILQTDNNANRAIVSGAPILSIAPHRTVRQILDDAGLAGGANTSTVKSVPLAKLGETWHGFVRRYLDRAGLFLWAAGNGTFVLSAPDGNQAPSYRILRQPGGKASDRANAVGCSFRDLGTGRHTEVVIYGRGGGRILGRVKAKGLFLDQDFIDAGYSNQALVKRDANVHSVAEAEYLARRIIAEERRQNWSLEYTIPGLTLPYLPSGGSQRAVIVPDCVVTVDDAEIGIQGDYYIETVTQRRSPETTTVVRLMRVADLEFGTLDTAD